MGLRRPASPSRTPSGSTSWPTRSFLTSSWVPPGLPKGPAGPANPKKSNMHSTRFSALTVSVFLLSLGSSQVAAQLQGRFGEPVPGLTPTELSRFQTGKTEGFDHSFTAPEGLGPTFNDVSCQHCHADPASGGGSTIFVTRFGI